jgi:ABC-type transport system involved in cytochrome bd biosynthesis fused ATPase/permease subunit
MEYGDQTVVGSKGLALSAGQKQRIVSQIYRLLPIPANRLCCCFPGSRISGPR